MSIEDKQHSLDGRLSRSDTHDIQETSWGRLVWQVSAEMKNSDKMTVGICFINPGQENGRHVHPNCEEVLTVVRGHIIHTWNDQMVEMRQGDAIAIPAGVVHNARNIGGEVAELGICFSSAYRETIAVDD